MALAFIGHTSKRFSSLTDKEQGKVEKKGTKEEVAGGGYAEEQEAGDREGEEVDEEWAGELDRLLAEWTTL